MSGSAGPRSGCVMPVIGVILGLALASKWVALYAIASIGILILIRSALGRLIAILGLAGGTGILGWMAIGEMTTQPNTGNPPAVMLLIGVAPLPRHRRLRLGYRRRHHGRQGVHHRRVRSHRRGPARAGLLHVAGTIQNGAPNYTFFVIMLTHTALAAAANAYHPIAWTREEIWFAIGGRRSCSASWPRGRRLVRRQRARSCRSEPPGIARWARASPGGVRFARPARLRAAGAAARPERPRPTPARPRPPRPAGCASARASACRPSGWPPAC